MSEWESDADDFNPGLVRWVPKDVQPDESARRRMWAIEQARGLFAEGLVGKFERGVFELAEELEHYVVTGTTPAGLDDMVERMAKD